MTHDEKRLCRRELINWHLQHEFTRHGKDNPFYLRDIKFLVRNGEVYRYGETLNVYKVGAK